MACDVCGKLGTPLNMLLKAYQTTKIKSVCPECERIINIQHSNITDSVFKIRAEWVKRFILNRRAAQEQGESDERPS